MLINFAHKIRKTKHGLALDANVKYLLSLTLKAIAGASKINDQTCWHYTSNVISLKTTNTLKEASVIFKIWLLSIVGVKELHKIHVFVNIFVESRLMDDVVLALSKLKNVEELYEVTGEFDIVTLVSAGDFEEFRNTLKNEIMKIPGVRSTVSSIILQAHKGPKCQT